MENKCTIKAFPLLENGLLGRNKRLYFLCPRLEMPSDTRVKVRKKMGPSSTKPSQVTFIHGWEQALPWFQVMMVVCFLKIEMSYIDKDPRTRPSLSFRLSRGCIPSCTTNRQVMRNSNHRNVVLTIPLFFKQTYSVGNRQKFHMTTYSSTLKWPNCASWMKESAGLSSSMYQSHTKHAWPWGGTSSKGHRI